MNLDLTGRTALVTGSTQGIGLAIAAGLARAGARTAVNGRTQSKADAAVERIHDQTNGSDVVGVAADVATAEGAETVVETLPEVDILVGTTDPRVPAPHAGKRVRPRAVHRQRLRSGDHFVYELVDRDLPWNEAQREFMRRHRPQSLPAAADRAGRGRHRRRVRGQHPSVIHTTCRSVAKPPGKGKGCGA